MLTRIFKSVLIGVFSLVMIASFTSCQKEKETIGIIIVKDSGGAVVPGADVILSFPALTLSSQGDLPDPSLTKGPKKTDANGQAEFAYELEAILNIEVTKEEGNSIYTGFGIMKLERGKSITKVVEIN